MHGIAECIILMLHTVINEQVRVGPQTLRTNNNLVNKHQTYIPVVYNWFLIILVQSDLPNGQ